VQSLGQLIFCSVHTVSSPNASPIYLSVSHLVIRRFLRVVQLFCVLNVTRGSRSSIHGSKFAHTPHSNLLNLSRFIRPPSFDNSLHAMRPLRYYRVRISSTLPSQTVGVGPIGPVTLSQSRIGRRHPLSRHGTYTFPPSKFLLSS
jgi:hypothetical protein